ncbi:MAG: UDP-N-acetylmuramoyl-L-alanine--D-glutamate ligase [Candidatus Sungbacteria bacterium]|nr:UDP-N-acetylmuramoyl-L-alanine--D-glutamate ligase [Candidatus Sungbacteria bacterium]
MQSPTDFKSKKVLVMGLGLHGGGAGAARFFTKARAKVTVTDLKTKKELAPSLAELKKLKKITYHLGGHRASDFKNADFVIKNPGVPESSNFVTIAECAGVPVLSDVEIFFKLCPAKIIGVTGTKGKSTAAWLISQFLKSAGKRVIVGGNIRKSVLDLVDAAKKSDWVVLELSSFQLDSLAKSRLSPEVALITNIFPDHLNRYPNFRAYADSKTNIFKHQKKNDWLFFSADDKLTSRLAKKAPSKVLPFAASKTIGPFIKFIANSLPDYQRSNIAAAIAVAKHIGVGDRVIKKTLRQFTGLKGRMEVVGKVRGIEFINDTTATNPEAAEKAVVFTKKQIGRGSLHIIAGGSDKSLPLAGFVAALKKHAATVIFLPGGSTEKMKAGLGKSDRPKIVEVKTMRQAVRSAFTAAKKGDAVLLSPGAASFGLFKHEFDRGEKFVQEVRRLPANGKR